MLFCRIFVVFAVVQAMAVMPAAAANRVALVIGNAAYTQAGSLTNPVNDAADMAKALTGFGFSAYLTYRELFTIHAICQWCVGSAIVMTTLAILTGYRALRDDSVEPPDLGTPSAPAVSGLERAGA